MHQISFKEGAGTSGCLPAPCPDDMQAHRPHTPVSLGSSSLSSSKRSLKATLSSSFLSSSFRRFISGKFKSSS